MDALKSVLGIIIASVPVGLTYLLGWYYLYFYFESFGINIAELQLDFQTILIYAYPPLMSLKIFFSFIFIVYSIIIIAGIVVFTLIFARPLAAVLRRLSSSGALHQTALLLIFVCAMVLMIAFGLVPLAKSTAEKSAMRLWSAEAPQVAALLKDIPKADNHLASAWTQNYEMCAQRSELGLIFSDQETYFMLCRGQDEPKSGIVFEVKKKDGLVSARYVYGGGRDDIL